MFTITNQTVASVASSAPPKGITFPNNVAASAVIYTIPSGRKFVGRIGNTQNNGRTQINDVYIYAYHGASTAVAQSGSFGEMTLIAGTVVKEGTANTSYIWGTEYDI